MPARISEAIVLRTYPLKEADLIVSFLTRDQGKLRGVAKRARKPKNGFGASLERLSHGKMFYFQRETRDLVNLDACELIHSHFGLHGDFTVSVALDFISEVSEQFLPAAEVNEKFFRLLLTALEHLRESARNVWRVVTYFSLWVVRLAGLLPALDVCMSCGAWLEDPEHPERAFFTRSAEGFLLQRLPRERQLGDERGIESDRRRDVEEAGGRSIGRWMVERDGRRPAPFFDPANGRSHRAQTDYRSGARSVIAHG